jgi:hypothetical protein
MQTSGPVSVRQNASRPRGNDKTFCYAHDPAPPWLYSLSSSLGATTL